MSRVGNRTLEIPAGVTINVKGTLVEVAGKLGTLTKDFSPLIAVVVKDNYVTTTRSNEDKHTKQLHGTTNALIQGMIEGVSKGFLKELEIKGVGYRAAMEGKKLVITAGYSHTVPLDIIDGVKVELVKPTEIKVTSIDKQKVGEMAAQIRDVRRPSVYSGKGIMYKGEKIRRKEGKTAKK